MTRKGYLSELEAVHEYEQRGWLVFKPQKVSKYGTQDIFNMFDFLAISPDGSEIDFVQVKTNSTRGFLKKLKEWRERHKVKKVEWLLMVRLDARKHK
ncbi:MAG: hypothetical protein J7J46_05780, partial [Candidatus Desulfofervidus sp.]|nr:hypothetical protein [Candidatus Desulfofervidus sp.]